jgi:uncharacterized DUF497 family protein
MIDFGRIEGFDWDGGNGRKNLDKHGVTQLEAEQVFLDPALLVLTDQAHSDQEERFQAYGETEAGNQLHVSFTLRNEGALIRVISARPMSRKERDRYEEEKS